MNDLETKPTSLTNLINKTFTTQQKTFLLGRTHDLYPKYRSANDEEWEFVAKVSLWKRVLLDFEV